MNLGLVIIQNLQKGLIGLSQHCKLLHEDFLAVGTFLTNLLELDS